eukprot:PhF_6_TR6983/c0_g1_i2/m.10341
MQGLEIVQNTSILISPQSSGRWTIQWWIAYSGPYYNEIDDIYIRESYMMHLSEKEVVLPMYANCLELSITASSKSTALTWAYMHDARMLDVFLNTILPHPYEGWMCAQNNGTDWIWECGPAAGKTVRELGFSNWGSGEPNASVQLGCLHVSREGLWSSKICSEQSWRCLQYYKVLNVTGGYVTVNAITAKPTFQPPMGVTVMNATEGANLPLFGLDNITVSTDSNVSGIIYHMSPTESRCEPITTPSHFSVKNLSNDFRTITFPKNTTLNDALTTIKFTPCSLSNTSSTANVEYNLTWWIMYSDRAYYNEYNMYLTSLGDDECSQIGYRVALSSTNVNSFVRDSGLEGGTCGYRDVNCPTWTYDCGFDDEENYTPPQQSAIPTVTSGALCEYVQGSVNNRTVTSIPCSAIPSHQLCWVSPFGSMGSARILVVPQKATSNRKPLNSIFRDPYDVTHGSVVMGATVAMAVVSPPTTPLLQCSVGFTMVNCDGLSDDNNEDIDEAANVALSPLHYFFGYGPFGRGGSSGVIWNGLLTAGIVLMQCCGVVITMFVTKTSGSVSCARVYFPKFGVITARLLLVGTSFFMGRYFASARLTPATGTFVILCFLFVYMYSVVGVLVWHLYPKSRGHHRSYRSVNEGPTTKWFHRYFIPRGQWRESDTERAMNDVLFDEWVPDRYWWIVLHMTVSCIVAGLSGGASLAPNETSCSSLVSIAGILQIVHGVFVLWVQPTRIRVLSCTASLGLVTSGAIGLMKSARQLTSMYSVCEIILAIVALIDGCVQVYALCYEYKNPPREEEPGWTGPGNNSLDVNLKIDSVGSHEEELRQLCAARTLSFVRPRVDLIGTSKIESNQNVEL